MSAVEISAPLDNAATASTPPPVDLIRKKARERRHAIARNARHALLGLLLAGAGVFAVLAMRPQPVPIDVARVVRGPLVVAIAEDGTTRVKDRYVVSAPVTGSLSRLGLEPGDAVKEGDPLAEIAPTQSPLLDERTRAEAQARLGAALSALGQAQAQVSRARVAKELAEQELARTKKLAANGSISAQALEQAEFGLRMRSEELASAEFGGKVAVEEVRIARVALGREGSGAPKDRHVDVLSPVSGRVLGIHHKSAGVVQASTPLVEVGDPSALEVVVDLLTTDAVHVLPGTPVVIRGWGGDHPLDGRVRRIEPSAFTRPSALGVDEQRVNVIVALTEPRGNWETLGDGYRVEARIVLWQAERVLKVPQGAVFRHGDGWAVFAVNGNVARLTPVTLGHRGETEAEISAGLAEGTAVAVHPGDRVKDGARVEPR
ncbi:MAG TPA: HlyD family efflux transporter periplasmic adaptor subunit [Polyangiaceae bacterium]|nr:HlyD family efflux transporter periplasmic adaptor subunit [Polyangiaceae bacterium]